MSKWAEHLEQPGLRLEEPERRELLDVLEQATFALRVAIPYVNGRIFPVGAAGRDWRSETAEQSLETITSTLRALERARAIAERPGRVRPC